ncbi:hypothetical protein [Streptomyces sp. CA-179760]|uniref:hypothetical protein n=1 Tax=Streptomyces sp. CA-179760 TaxID=3240054 RepID=UPI003D94802D
MEQHPVLLATVTTVVGSLITGGAMYAAQSGNRATDRQNAVQATTKPTGKITTPGILKAGDKFRLSGWIKDVPEGYALWAFSEQVSSGKLWPQYQPCRIDDVSGAWTCPDLRVDGIGDVGQDWQVRVALVTAQNAVDIKAYAIAKEYKDEQRDGFAGLPDGAIPIHEEKVLEE